MRRFLTDVGSLILAVGLAVIVWIAAVNEENPISVGQWPESIPIEIINQPAGTIIVGDVPTRAQVTIRAPKRSWDNLVTGSFRAYLDLSQAVNGFNQVPVKVECSDRNVEIRETRPSAVTIRLENLKQVQLPVKVDILDAIPFGFEVRRDEITVDPPTVTVSGPEQLVNQVAEVVADFYLRGATQTVERKTTVQARDRQGGVVAVTLQPNPVLVKVPIVQRRGFRNLSVRVVWEGQPASGYRISNVSVDPTIVTAIGDPATIESIPGYLETAPVKVDGATGDIVERVPLVLPENVSVLGSQAVQVVISVTPIESSLTVRQPVLVQGLSLAFTATPSPATVDVILSGPLPKLDALRAQDVQVVVDLFGLEAGSHQLVPIVIVPEGIRVQSVVPEKIQVEITPRVSPTFTPTGTPTPTLTPTATPTPWLTITPTSFGETNQTTEAGMPTPIATETITSTATLTATVTMTPTPIGQALRQ